MDISAFNYVDYTILAVLAASGLLAMLRGFRVPDGLFCHYPVYMIDPMRFYPSTLLCLDEELLNQGFLTFALACFTRKGGNPDKNCVISPLYAPDAMLRRLPPVKLMVAEVDCLRDQAFALAIRILKLGGYCQLILMRDFIHGFQSMDTNLVGIEEYRRGTNLTIEHFVKLFNHIKWLREQQLQTQQTAHGAGQQTEPAAA